jgi:hypothetical protein
MKLLATILARGLDIVCFVLGPAILVANALDFKFKEAVGDNSITIGYFFEPETRNWIAFGVALIALGFVRRSWIRERKED